MIPSQPAFTFQPLPFRSHSNNNVTTISRCKTLKHPLHFIRSRSSLEATLLSSSQVGKAENNNNNNKNNNNESISNPGANTHQQPTTVSSPNTSTNFITDNLSNPLVPQTTTPKKLKPTDWATRTRSRPPPRSRAFQSVTEDRLISRISGCTRRLDWYSAHVAFTHFIGMPNNENIVPSARLIGAYVNALCRGGRFDLAREKLSYYSSFGCDSSIARASIICALAHHQGANHAYHELLITPRHLWSVHAVTCVIHALGITEEDQELNNNTIINMTMDVLKRSKDECNLSLDIQLYNAALRTVARKGHINLAHQLLREMRDDQLDPNDITFEALLYACAHAQRTELGSKSIAKRACVIFDAASEKKLVTPRVVSAFASVVLRAGMWNDERVGKVVRMMEHVVQTMDEIEMKKKGMKKDIFETKLYRLRVLRARGLSKKR